MATTTRTFTIYIDGPASPPRAKSNASSSDLNVITADNKENLDPFTGRRPSHGDKFVKKRKTGALATKLLLTKTYQETQPDLKKRRVVDASKTASAKERKEKRVLSNRKEKNGSLSRGRLPSELPIVEEVSEVEEVPSAEQAAIDSRCYELTVLPLADVSEAYSPVSEKEAEHSSPLKSSSPASRETSPTPAVSEGIKASTTKSSSDALPLILNTPERKRIYSTFTFSSPSPAGERYAASSRASSVERFTDSLF
ncbi:hypothetical protein C8Q75DRAFT_731617 [Abortiporus biennis]|nr:hypothetical protein C8Q75DRAFT_731617 [Abortiporus biennis]